MRIRRRPNGSISYRLGTFTKHCPTLRGIINSIAAKKRITPDKIEDMVEFYHNWVYDCISSENAPTVYVPNFGRLQLSPFRIRSKIVHAIKRYREGKATYEETKEQVERYYPLWKRGWWESLKRGKGIVRRNGTVRKSLGNLLKRKLMQKWEKK